MTVNQLLLMLSQLTGWDSGNLAGQRPALPIQRLIPFLRMPPKVHDLTLPFPLFKSETPLEVTCDINIPASTRVFTNNIGCGTFAPHNQESTPQQHKWPSNEQLAVHTPIITVRSLQVAPCIGPSRNFSPIRNKAYRPQVRASDPSNPVRVILSSYYVGAAKPTTDHKHNQPTKRHVPQGNNRARGEEKIEVGDDWCVIETSDYVL